MSAPPRRAPDDLLVHLRRARDHADRHYAQPLDLGALAAVAGISKYHFQRLFTATYGVSPAAHLSQRRVERAQDLLRATNLTVTEVCHAVGFASLGSFSSRFREVVGETPSEFQRRWAAAERRTSRAASCSCGGWPNGPQARRSGRRRPPLGWSHDHENLIASVFVKDVDESKAFYNDCWASRSTPTSPSARATAGAP